MTKKDYERAARIVQDTLRTDARIDRLAKGPGDALVAEVLQDVFVKLFRGDNPRFDEFRFRRACEPGANVRARKAS